MSRSRQVLLPWGIVLAVSIATVTAIVLDQLAADARGSALTSALSVVAILSSATVGFVLARRRPTNSIGWILLASALFLSLDGLTTSYAEYGILAHPGALPAANWAVAFEDRTWPLLFVGVTAIAFVFPDGRVPAESRRAARGTALAFTLLVLAAIFSTDPFSVPFDSVDNPIPAIPDPLVLAFYALGLLGSIAGMVSAAVSLRARFRSATGIERLQMRWLTLAAASIPAVIAVCLLESALTGGSKNSEGLPLTLALGFALIAIPVTIGLAVMRYRLYEIDRVINRTLVYASLTVVLAAAFALVSIVVGVTAGSGSTVPTAIATLVVVVAFSPLRARLQIAVDRRFDRARYDGLRRVDAFLGDLRAGRAAPEAAERVLSEALGDPSLELLFWLSEEDPFVDSSGARRNLEKGAGRTSTPVRRGALRLGTVVHDARTADHPDLLDSVIGAAGLAIEIGRLRVEVRLRLAEVEESRARIISAGNEERRRLERDLHDGAQQRLVSIGLELRHLQRGVADEEGGTHDALDGVVADLGVAIAELRELARGVRPPALDEGLASALRQLGERAPLPTSVETMPGRLDQHIEAAAYFVASEALTNAVKHSGATRASINASRRNGRLMVSIADDGVGGAAPANGSGLEGIADRLAALGGTLTLTSISGEGTVVLAELPCA